MTRFRFLGLVIMVGLVLGLSSCGDVIDKPTVDVEVETQRTADTPTMFVSTLEYEASGKCADVPRATKRVGANFIQYTCNNQDNQLFLFESVDDETFYFTVRSLTSGLCMSVSPSEKLGGNPVIEQAVCTGKTNQQFGLIYTSREAGGLGIEAGRNSDRCLNVDKKSRVNRAQLVTSDCSEETVYFDGYDEWSLSDRGPAFTTEIIDDASFKCADVPRFSRQVGTDLIVYDCNGQTNQQFDFLRVRGREHLIRSVSSGLCVTFPSEKNGVIEQRECKATTNQRFTIKPLSDDLPFALLEVDTPSPFKCLGVEPLPLPGNESRGIPVNRNNLIPYPCTISFWQLPGGVGNFGGSP